MHFLVDHTHHPIRLPYCRHCMTQTLIATNLSRVSRKATFNIGKLRAELVIVFVFRYDLNAKNVNTPRTSGMSFASNKKKGNSDTHIN